MTPNCGIPPDSREQRIRAFFLNHPNAKAMADKMMRWDPPFDAGSWLTVRKNDKSRAQR